MSERTALFEILIARLATASTEPLHFTVSGYAIASPWLGMAAMICSSSQRPILKAASSHSSAAAWQRNRKQQPLRWLQSHTARAQSQNSTSSLPWPDGRVCLHGSDLHVVSHFNGMSYRCHTFSAHQNMNSTIVLCRKNGVLMMRAAAWFQSTVKTSCKASFCQAKFS